MPLTSAGLLNPIIAGAAIALSVFTAGDVYGSTGHPAGVDTRDRYERAGMIGMVAGARRSALVLAVVVGMVVALFTACCCLEQDHASAADPLAAAHVAAAHVAAPLGASHHVTAGRDGGHTEQDCQESAVAVGAASVPGPLIVAATRAGAPAAGQATPRAGTPGSVALPPPQVAHLLCVMRT